MNIGCPEDGTCNDVAQLTETIIKLVSAIYNAQIQKAVEKAIINERQDIGNELIDQLDEEDTPKKKWERLDLFLSGLLQGGK